MAIQIKFDNTHNVIHPTFVLATRGGKKICKIPSYSIVFADRMNKPSEISFRVNKSDCRLELQKLWEQIVDFKLLWVQEWDKWFEIYVEVDETNDTVKNVSAKSLGEAELSQINLYNIEINTEDDIAREDYEPVVLYDEINPNSSLLSRVLEKAPHYTINHVDTSIANIQRTFSFDDKSIYDAFQEISEEINCIFIFNCHSDINGKIIRDINIYDLESHCLDCGERGDFLVKCEKCGSKNIDVGYGKDTTIFISTENLADNVKYSTDNGSVKNCFKLEAGDDLMTATIRNCNPNGTDYIWYISESTKEDMSRELVDKIESYDDLYEMYQKDYVPNFDSVLPLFSAYNFLIEKYKVYNSDLEKITLPIIGYPALMNAYYNTIDFETYLQTSLMPTVEMSKSTSKEEVLKLTTETLSPVSVSSIDNISLATANNAVLSMAKVIIDSRFKVEIGASNLENSGTNQIWTGSFVATNYSDESDVATSDNIEIVINDDYESFVYQKIEKSLKKDDTDDLSVSGLFKKSDTEFIDALREYSLDCLNSFYNSCQSCIDILIEQGIADKETWSGKEPDLYNSLYLSYLRKLSFIEGAINERQGEINLIIGVYDTNNELKQYGLQSYIIQEKNKIQTALDFENHLGSELWLEFCSYRREDTYKNDNYISDGLSNSDLFKNALNFIESANKDIFRAATLQHSISATLKNLLTIKEFEPIVDYFEVGNWLRIRVDSKIYRLRLLEYEIDFDNLDDIDIKFSDVIDTMDGTNDVESILNQSTSMASSYGYVSRQAKQGNESNNQINNWISNGLSLNKMKIVENSEDQTQTWDEHGMLFRKYDSIDDCYDNVQLKIINSTIAVTDDNWKTVKTAIGYCYYYDPITNELKNTYGINGETIVGKLFIGENLTISNDSGNLTFNNDGFNVTNGVNIVSINPNNDSIFNIKNNNADIFSFDENGDLDIIGNITAQSLTLSDGVYVEPDRVRNLSSVATSGDYNDLTNTPALSKVAISGSYNDLGDTPLLSDVALSGSYNDLSDIPVLSAVATSGDYKDLSNVPELSKVALTGSYNDLIDTPDLSKIESNAQSIADINIQIESIKSQIEALNNAVFNGGNA